MKDSSRSLDTQNTKFEAIKKREKLRIMILNKFYKEFNNIHHIWI